MTKLKHILRTLLAGFLILHSAEMVQAQSNMILYHNKVVPQRTFVNPAFRSDAKIFIGVPALSSHYINFGNTTLNFDLLSNSLEENATGTTLNLSKLGENFYKNNYLSLQYDLDLLSAGFKIRKGYVFFNTRIRQDFRFRYPGDWFKFATQGNGYGNLGYEFDFGFGLDFMQYNEISVGYNRKFLNDRLTLGGSLKYLLGTVNVNTRRNSITWETDPNTFDWTVGADMHFRGASNFVNTTNFASLVNFNPGQINLRNIFGNYGLGVDLGAEFKLNEKITLSASLNNLGYIRWKANPIQVQSRNPGAKITFEGLGYYAVFDTSENGASSEEVLNRLQDSILNTFALDTFRTAYTTSLFPEFYLGGEFHLTKNHSVGVILYGTYFQRRLSPAFTLTYNGRLTRVLSLSASYTTLNRTFLNGGLGLSLNLGPTQLYFMSDNILGAINAQRFKSINARIGMNLTLGRKDKKKGMTDQEAAGQD
jgi:hypothetical protein